MATLTLQDVIDCKKINDSEYNKELIKLNKFAVGDYVYKLCGNNIIYHHQFANLIRTPS